MNVKNVTYIKPAVDMINENTKFNIILIKGGEYVSGCRLNRKQLNELENTGNLM